MLINCAHFFTEESTRGNQNMLGKKTSESTHEEYFICEED